MKNKRPVLEKRAEKCKDESRKNWKFLGFCTAEQEH
jgi:hypothetical protein